MWRMWSDEPATEIREAEGASCTLVLAPSIVHTCYVMWASGGAGIINKTRRTADLCVVSSLYDSIYPL